MFRANLWGYPMRSLKTESLGGLEAAHDLRRKRSRQIFESIRQAARHLPDEERVLIDDIFEHATPVSVIARRSGEDPRAVSRRVRRITRRLLDPRFRFVAEHRTAWRPTQSKVAKACVLEGLSIREASKRLGLSRHTVRRHKEAIDALFELIPSAGNES